MQERLFRKAALERMSSPDRLDELMQVVPIKGWLAAIALIGLSIAAIFWSFTGRLQMMVNGSGILIRGGRLFTIEAPVAGQILRLEIEPGDVIEEGVEIAQIECVDMSETTSVYSPLSGRVLEIRTSEGAFTQPGTELVALEKSDEPLEAIIYVSPTDGKRIEPGMPVQLLLSTVEQEEYGHMLGAVETVGQYPATTQGMMMVLGSEDLLELLATQGGSIEVHVRLETNEVNPSGYEWSSGFGPEIEIQSGTMVNTRIILRDIHPIDLILVDR
jgi:multidrug efflux pump subunit AcrA (membrane-fusion protein)